MDSQSFVYNGEIYSAVKHIQLKFYMMYVGLQLGINKIYINFKYWCVCF
jgi:hypothetical protein